MTAHFHKSFDSNEVTASPAAPGVLIASANSVPDTSSADMLFKAGERVFILLRPRLICAGVQFGSGDPLAWLWLYECKRAGCFRILVEHDDFTGLPEMSASGVSDLDAVFDLREAGAYAPRGSRLHRLQREMRRGTL